MKARGVKGSIVLITSTNGINSQSQISTHYDSSKAAQGQMMKMFAEHYAPAGIRINGIAPGWIAALTHQCRSLFRARLEE
jgi:3-oxoacyl-[acyl-carrier protein] reductase